jgi:hypothetical protein
MPERFNVCACHFTSCNRVILEGDLVIAGVSGAVRLLCANSINLLIMCMPMDAQTSQMAFSRPA